MQRANDLLARTKQFALATIKFCEGLPKDETSRVLGRQLLRSGTSVGANYLAVHRQSPNRTSFPKWVPSSRRRVNPLIGWNSFPKPGKSIPASRLRSITKQKNLLQLPFPQSTRHGGTWNPRSNSPWKLLGRRVLHSAFCILHFPPAHAISTKNKHLLLSCDTNPRIHGGSFGV